MATPKRTEALARAQRKWKDKNQVMKAVAFNRENDADILAWIEKSGRPFGALVKAALRAEMDLEADD